MGLQYWCIVWFYSVLIPFSLVFLDSYYWCIKEYHGQRLPKKGVTWEWSKFSISTFFKFMTHKMLNISQNNQLTLVFACADGCPAVLPNSFGIISSRKYYCLLKASIWPFLLFLLSDLYLWTHPILKFFPIHLARGWRLLHTLSSIWVDMKMDVFCMSHHLQRDIHLSASLFLIVLYMDVEEFMLLNQKLLNS